MAGRSDRTNRTARATRPPLSRQRALQVAVELADIDGLGSVTMRRLAQELGVEAMSLYHHVANKEDILDGMVDLVFTEVDLPRPGTDWTAAMRQRAHSVRSALRRHPWAISLMESRAAPGPATLRHHDAVIGCLRQAGFSVAMTAHAYSVLDAYIYGFAHVEIQLPFDSAQETQVLAEQMLPPALAAEYPHLFELTVEHVLRPGYDYADEFDFGLTLILDGLGRAARSARAPGHSS